MKYIFIFILAISLSTQVKRSYFFPKSTLPPLNVTDYGNLAQLEDKYMNSITNEEILNSLAENSQNSNSTAVLDYISMKPESIRSRIFQHDPDDWHWMYNNQKKEFVLPDIVKNEPVWVKWKRVFALLKSMNWAKMPTTKPLPDAQITNPPVIEDLYGRVEGEREEKNKSTKENGDSIVPPLWSEEDSSFLK